MLSWFAEITAYSRTFTPNVGSRCVSNYCQLMTSDTDYIPRTMNIGLNLAYRLSEKSVSRWPEMHTRHMYRRPDIFADITPSMQVYTSRVADVLLVSM